MYKLNNARCYCYVIHNTYIKCTHFTILIFLFQEIEPNNEMSKPMENKTDIKNTNFKNEISTSKQNKTTAISSKILNVIVSSTPISLEPKEVAKNVQNKLYFSNNNFEAMPKRFQPNPNQKGLMKRFLASRGKISSGFTFLSNNILPSHNHISVPIQHPPSTDTFFIGNTTGENNDVSKLHIDYIFNYEY